MRKQYQFYAIWQKGLQPRYSARTFFMLILILMLILAVFLILAVLPLVATCPRRV
jgi:hypothetical protein